MHLKQFAYRLVTTALAAFLISGLLFNFSFFETVDVQLHDAYIVINPLFVTIVVWVLFLGVAITVDVIRRKFSPLLSTRILLLLNTGGMVLAGLFVYWTYATFIGVATLDFIGFNLNDRLFDQFFFALLKAGVILALFFFVEIWLIIKLIKIRWTKK